MPRNYDRNRIKRVYNYVGTDRALSSVHAIPPISVVFSDEELDIHLAIDDPMTGSAVIEQFDFDFGENPLSFFVDSTGADMKLGNLFTLNEDSTDSEWGSEEREWEELEDIWNSISTGSGDITLGQNIKIMSSTPDVVATGTYSGIVVKVV